MGYSGLTFGLGSLAGDVYINNVIGSSVEIVSYFIAFLVIPGGRKKVYVSLTAIGGVGLIVSAIVQEFLPGKYTVPRILTLTCMFSMLGIV